MSSITTMRQSVWNVSWF